MTRIFLAGITTHDNLLRGLKIPFILESYYYLNDKSMDILKSYEYDMFLLDSGAFTFLMKNSESDIDFNSYLDGYINFINKHDIDYFFELDIDVLVGYEKVKVMRNRLERETGKKCIPVWHKSRGLDEYKRLTREYPYIAIGGIAKRNITKKDYKYFKPLLEIAHRNGCQVHGLGFTTIREVEKYNFDSVDSTTWIGSRFGRLFYFDGKTLKKIEGAKRGIAKKINRHNAEQWIRYARYLDKQLRGIDARRKGVDFRGR